MNTAVCSLAKYFGSVMVVPFFPFRYCLGGQMFLPDIFLTLSHTCFIGVSADSFDTYSAHDWHFFWLKSRRAFACDPRKADMVSPLNSRLCRTLLSWARQAFRASRHSSSNQGFDFLGMVVALGLDWIGLDLFNDDTPPSGHISRPTQVNVSQSCFHSLNNYSSLIILYTSGG